MASNEPTTVLQRQPAEASEQLDWYSIIDLMDVPDHDKEGIKKWIRESEANHIEILVTGRTGVGKSTLINGLVGKKVAEEGHGLCPKTMSVTKYSVNTKDGFEIVVWDSPGLQDGTENEEAYLAEMKKKCSNVDIVIYCLKMSIRSALGENQKDFSAIQKLTGTFGAEWWKHAIFVLTFANAIEAQLKTRYRLEIVIKEKFEAQTKEWKVRIHAALSSAGVPQEVASKVPVEPAGHIKKPHLPGLQYWHSILWFTCADRTKRQSQPILVKMNAKRFKNSKDVNPTDFTSKESHEQPIVIDHGLAAAGIVTGLGVAINGVAIGAGVGAVIGAAGAGVGAAVGVVVGGAAGAALGLMFYFWQKHELKKKNTKEYPEEASLEINRKSI